MPAKSNTMTDDGDRPQKYQTGIDDEEYIQALQSIGPSTTPEVADEVGVPDRTALYRLKQLEEDDVVTSRKVGTALLWQLSDE